MDNILFTSKYEIEDESSLSQNILSALIDIRNKYDDQDINPIKWDAQNIAIPLKLKINLPFRGTINNIDIRRNEPIFLLFDKKLYPYKAPSAWSNRIDFPKKELPHLNPKSPGSPANFCLHRGSIDTWFSEHNILEFIDRIQDWLFDASRNRLIGIDDGFEATRIDESYGSCIYNPNIFFNEVNEKWKKNRNKAGFCYTKYTLLNNAENEPLVNRYSIYTIKFNYFLRRNIPTVKKLFLEFNSCYNEKNQIDRHLLGILIWPNKNQLVNRYFADLPINLKQLLSLSNTLGLPLKTAINSYIEQEIQFFKGIPITIIIPRPRNVLRTDSHLELLNFLISYDNIGKIISEDNLSDCKVYSMRQYHPLTLKRAKDISSTSNEHGIGKTLFLGCGAIGSKLGLHLAKSGLCDKITFIDYDILFPHNLIRHGLLTESLGVNKAEAMKTTIEKIYSDDLESIQIDIVKDNLFNVILDPEQKIFNQHSWIIDSTASSIIRNILVQKWLPSSISLCRCEIADDGSLGLMSFEGYKRNPRLDDILFFIYDLSIEHFGISKWLINFQKQGESNPENILDDINIGISCNSETMRLADDLVSLHASLFSISFRKKIQRINKSHCGFLQISNYRLEEETIPLIQTFEIQPVKVISAENDKNWEVRIQNTAYESLMKSLDFSGINETGGILIGQVDPKNKIIYVTRSLPAPPDSKCFPLAFVRGVKDVPEIVTNIIRKSGEMLNYVGEWHTHPTGGKEMSVIDLATMKKIKSVLDTISRPTFIMIITKKGLYPHVFYNGS